MSYFAILQTTVLFLLLYVYPVAVAVYHAESFAWGFFVWCSHFAALGTGVVLAGELLFGKPVWLYWAQKNNR